MRHATKLAVINARLAKLENIVGKEALDKCDSIMRQAPTIEQLAASETFELVRPKFGGGTIRTSLSDAINTKKARGIKTVDRVKNENRKYRGGMRVETADTMIDSVGEPGSEERIEELRKRYELIGENDNSPFTVDLEDAIMDKLFPQLGKVYSISGGDRKTSDERYDG